MGGRVVAVTAQHNEEKSLLSSLLLDASNTPSVQIGEIARAIWGPAVTRPAAVGRW
jgi:hypothetical protein